MITLRAPALEMRGGVRARAEAAGALEHDVDAELAPTEAPPGRRSAKHRDRTSVDDERAVAGLDRAGKRPVDAVVAEQVRERRRVGEVVDADPLDVGAALEGGAERAASDAAEAVDGNCSHGVPPTWIHVDRRRAGPAAHPQKPPAGLRGSTRRLSSCAASYVAASAPRRSAAPA